MDDREILRQAKLELGLMDFEELVRRCRSYRRFDESLPLSRGMLLALVDVARKCASAANKQPLRYGLVVDACAKDALFSGLRWAAALPDWDGPAPGERPGGYLVVFSDGEPGSLTWVDCGIACQTIALAATEVGLGLCMLRSFDPKAVAAALPRVSSRYLPLLVLALGAPAETVVLENSEDAPDGVPYWRSAGDIHHVPKRSLDSIIIG